MSSNFLFVFSSIALREFQISSLRDSNILLKLLFRLFSFASSIFSCSSLVVVGSLGFNGLMLLFVVCVVQCVLTLYLFFLIFYSLFLLSSAFFFSPLQTSTLPYNPLSRSSCSHFTQESLPFSTCHVH